MTIFKSIGTHRVTRIIGKHISELILSNGICPGDKLSTEKELASQFNVSIATIRESLRGLEALGLVEKRVGKGGGIYVTAIKSEPIKLVMGNFLKRQEFSAKQLDQVRFVLEPAFVKIAALQRTADELELLEQNIHFCMNKLSKTKGNLSLRNHRAIGEKNVEFHTLIGQSTHNPIFAVTLDYLLDFMKDLKRTRSTPDINVTTRIVKAHLDIFSSIKAKKPGEAEKHMLSHLKYLETYHQIEDM